MGFCIGGKWCGKDACRQRCKSWFGAQPDIERACRGACNGNMNFSKDEFLCSGNWIDEAIIIAAYGYDPCPGSGPTVETYLDPLGDRQRADQEVEKWKPVLLIGAVLIIAALAALVIIAK